MSNPTKKLSVLGILVLVTLIATVMTVGDRPDAPVIMVLLINVAVLVVPALAGYWCAPRVELPGVFRSGSSWRANLLLPLGIGVAAGLVATAVNVLLLSRPPTSPGGNLPSISTVTASLASGLSSQIILSLGGISVFAWLATLVSGGRWTQGWVRVFWVIMSVVAGLLVYYGALAQGGDPQGAMFLIAVNGIIALAAGFIFIRDGLVASAGVHFWALLAWHTAMVLLPFSR